MTTCKKCGSAQVKWAKSDSGAWYLVNIEWDKRTVTGMPHYVTCGSEPRTQDPHNAKNGN